MTNNYVDKRAKEIQDWFFSDMLKSEEFTEELTEEQQNALNQLVKQYKEFYNTHPLEFKRNNEMDSGVDIIAKDYNMLHQDTRVQISFKTEKDRVKGVADMIRSPYPFEGLEKNKFIVDERMLHVIKNYIKVWGVRIQNDNL